MITPSFIFTIFMLTLGPIETIRTFFAMTQDGAHVRVKRRADRLLIVTRLVLLRSRRLFAATPEEAADAARAAS